MQLFERMYYDSCSAEITFRTCLYQSSYFCFLFEVDYSHLYIVPCNSPFPSESYFFISCLQFLKFYFPFKYTGVLFQLDLTCRSDKPILLSHPQVTHENTQNQIQDRLAQHLPRSLHSFRHWSHGTEFLICSNSALIQ